MHIPGIYRNIPAVLAYELYISQMIQYSRACGSNHDVLDIGLLLTRQLLNQVMKSSFPKLYGPTMIWLTALEYMYLK
jgi:hypothetical protein